MNTASPKPTPHRKRGSRTQSEVSHRRSGVGARRGTSAAMLMQRPHLTALATLDSTERKLIRLWRLAVVLLPWAVARDAR